MDLDRKNTKHSLGRRITSLALCFCLCGALCPAAVFAEEGTALESEPVVTAATPETAEPDVTEEPAAEESTAPAEEAESAAEAESETLTNVITSMKIIDKTGSADANGVAEVVVDTTDPLKGSAFGITTSEAVTFHENKASSSKGDLYVASVSGSTVVLQLNTGEADADATYQITLNGSSDGKTWDGSFGSDFDMTALSFAEELNGAGAALPAGSMTAGDSPVAAYKLYANSDASEVHFVLVPDGVVTHTVTYVVGNTTYVWTVEDGSTLAKPYTNEDTSGWFTNSDFSGEVSFTEKVTSDIQIYGQVAGSEADFLAALNAGKTAVIQDADDWELFVANAASVKAGQWIVLGTNIDCEDSTYNSMTFAGNFNGNGYMITNAAFSAVNGNSGMFAKLGGGQVVCNVKLKNITASYAGTYAGTLVGEASGSDGNRVTIQNVQVEDGTVSGRTAGGVAGYLIYADAKYCSTDEDTTVRGLANGGGIAGISYGTIDQSCAKTSTITALTTRGVGGIVGKDLEGGTVTHSWCVKSTVAGTSYSETNVLAGVSSATTTAQLAVVGMDSAWTVAAGMASTLDMTRCMYPAPTAAD